MALYTIHERGGLRTLVDAHNGYIKRTDIPVMPSKGWRVRGFRVAAPFGRLNLFCREATLLGQLQRLARLTLEDSMVFPTTGSHKYFVTDYDHGTVRVRMGGIIGVWLASEDASYPD